MRLTDFQREVLRMVATVAIDAICWIRLPTVPPGRRPHMRFMAVTMAGVAVLSIAIVPLAWSRRGSR